MPATSPTKAASVTFVATFSQDVTGVTASNFSLSGTATGGIIGTPTKSNGGLTWSIVITGISSANGTLELNLQNNTGIDGAGAGAAAMTTTMFDGQTYTLDHTAPTVAANTGLVVAPSSTSTKIYSVQLNAEDPDFTASSITYTVTVGPKHGTLKLNGVPTTSFTQEDINEDLVSYVKAASSTGSDSFTFTLKDPLGNVGGAKVFTISSGTVKSASMIDGSGGTVTYIQFTNGTVYQQAGSAAPTLVTATPTLAISAGLDTTGAADVTVEYASSRALWTHTGTNENAGWTKLNVASTIAGLVPKMFVGGLDGLVDVVFTNNQLWQISLAHVGTPTLLAGNVKFVAVGVHGSGAGAVEASFIAYLDNGATNGGVKEYYVSGGVGNLVSVTTDDAYAISASLDLSDTADLILSSRNAAGVTDHSDWAYRGAPLSLITNSAVSSIAIDAAGDDFYVLQSGGILDEYQRGSSPTTVTLVSSPVLVTIVIVPNGNTDVADFLFANDTLWQISGLGGSLVYTPLAT